ncbi:hypothetical protein [Staphylococcus simulans]|uniref:hypothetical protein n=1 Tax=Staphylococcus simulans TaxID=1286 RepID=UPI000D1DD615|nr:hypothetical protein [Staphylococcus simulans]PTJ36478.1 hypothetical protein BU024_10475 [Staphylococcus simulans]
MANKSIKTIEEVKNKIETTLKRIDPKKIDFGNVIMDEETNQFSLEQEVVLEDLKQNIYELLKQIDNEKDKIKQEKINQKLIDELNNGGENATVIANIFK